MFVPEVVPAVIWPSTPTELAAWYGALLSTGMLGLRLWEMSRSSRRIKVSARTDMITRESSTWSDIPDIETVNVLIEVANVGHRPITLKPLPYFGPKIDGKYLLIKGPWQPKDRLEEGERCVMLCEQAGLPLDKLKWVVVVDETGKEWKGKISKSRAK